MAVLGFSVAACHSMVTHVSTFDTYKTRSPQYRLERLGNLASMEPNQSWKGFPSTWQEQSPPHSSADQPFTFGGTQGCIDIGHMDPE